MSNEEFMQWKAKLVELTPEQKQQVILSLSTFGTGGGAQKDVEGDWLYTGIVDAFMEKNLVSTASLYSLQKTKGYRSYLDCADKVRRDLVKILGTSSRTRARSTLAYLAGIALVNYCDLRRIPLSASVVLRNTCHIIEAIEEQFPGYIRANMFTFVLQQTERARNGQHR